MKYKDLIQFESVDEIIKFDKLNDDTYRDRLVKTFVCSNAFENFIIPRICRELDLDSTQETRGLQIVGNYGTGKSHLMSLFSIIAEDTHYLDYLSNQKAKECLQKIAGRYKVVRFEISGTNSLWDMITYQIDKYLEEWGVDYSIYDDNRPVPYYDKLEKMLAAFEEAYPDKGFMFVIDEMLSYLQGHAQPHLLGNDLQVLQALGHISDRTKFRMVFGVQELIYQAPEFQFAADMLNHVADRYTDLKIEKSDVQFIVQERLLRKNAHQQQAIKERLQKRLDELGVKPYMDKNNPLGTSDNSPNCTVGIIVSGDHRVLTRLAFGDQDVDFTLQKSNAHVVLKQGIKDWAMDTYHWACDRWGAENIIGFDVHLDETTPHIQIQTIPVAKTKSRGRASVKYVHKDDKSKVLSHKEWEKLPEEIRSNFVRTEVERREKECVSYARVWGEDKYAVGRTYYQMHTDYYNEVGRKYGLERGDDLAMLPGEERHERVHKNKAILEAERQAKDSIVRNQMENERLEGQKEKMANEVQDMRKQKESLEGEVDKMEGQKRSVEQQKKNLEGSVSRLEEYAAALDIKEEDLIVPPLNTNPLVKKAWDDIKIELEKPIPTFGQKE